MTVVAHSSQGAPSGGAAASTRWRLYGAFAGLVLLVVVTGADALSRGDGYDMTRHWVSLLQHGERGWLATAAFALAGLAMLGSAPAFHSAQSSERHQPPFVTAIPGLVAVLGLALVVLAICPIDPSMEYPVRADVYVVSTTGRIHSVAGAVVLACSAALCWCIASVARHRRGTAAWIPPLARGSAAVVVAIFVVCSTLVVLSDAGSWEAARAGAFQRLALLVGGIWIGWYALVLAAGCRERPETDRTPVTD